MFAENLDVFMQDFGVPCQVRSYTFTGIFDMPSQTIGVGHGDVVSNEYSLLVKTADATAGGIRGGSTITINGQVFVVRERLLEDDGAFTRFTLRK